MYLQAINWKLGMHQTWDFSTLEFINLAVSGFRQSWVGGAGIARFANSLPCIEFICLHFVNYDIISSKDKENAGYIAAQTIGLYKKT